MQDQGKRLLMAVAAALGVLLLFQFVFPKKDEEPKPTTGSGSGLRSFPQRSWPKLRETFLNLSKGMR